MMQTLPESWRMSGKQLGTQVKTNGTHQRRTAHNVKADVTNFETMLALANDIGRKFEPDDVDGDEQAESAALYFLAQFSIGAVDVDGGPADFMRDMLSNYGRWHSLTPGQVKGILNLAVANVRRMAHIAPPLPKPTPEPPAPTPPGPPAPPIPTIHDGTYTVILNGESDYVTLRIHTAKQGNLAGKTMAQYLYGGDNDNSYTSFAFVNGNRASVWKRYQGSTRLVTALDVLLHGDAAEAGLRYAMESGNCFICGRTLTVPASLNMGMGPDCASKWS